MDILARPTGLEPVTLGLEMRGIEHTNNLVLHRFVILQRAYENGLKTHFLSLRKLTEKEINFYLNFASGFGILGKSHRATERPFNPEPRSLKVFS